MRHSGAVNNFFTARPVLLKGSEEEMIAAERAQCLKDEDDRARQARGNQARKGAT